MISETEITVYKVKRLTKCDKNNPQRKNHTVLQNNILNFIIKLNLN